MKIIIKNLAVEYSDEGAGPVMLFLHGWKDNFHTFDAIASAFSDTHRVIRIDLPGFGSSESPKEIWRLDDYAQVVHDFIAKLNVKVDVLVGHSFGGRIVIKGVATQTIEAKKIVLVASAGIAKTQTMRNSFFRILAKVGKVITLIPPFLFWRRKLRQRLYSALGSDYLATGALKDTFLNIIKEDISTEAAQITVPTLLIWGDADKATPLGDGEKISKLIRGSSLKILKGASHMVHQERAQEVSRFINEFAS